MGIPIGNNFSVGVFLTGKYLQAKAALVRASVGAATPIRRGQYKKDPSQIPIGNWVFP